MRPLTQSSPEGDVSPSLLQLSIALSDSTAGKYNYASNNTQGMLLGRASDLIKVFGLSHSHIIEKSILTVYRANMPCTITIIRGNFTRRKFSPILPPALIGENIHVLLDDRTKDNVTFTALQT